MTDSPSKSAPLVTILTVMAGFALFLVVIHYVYVPRQTGVYTDDGMHTAAQRAENLAKLRAAQSKQAGAYAWVDQKAGIVQLPIDRAMELTVQKYAPQK